MTVTKTVRPRPAAPVEASSAPKAVQSRMDPADRRQQILDQAIDFFATHGLNAQTRALAQACGISQRLLYRYFPTKDALLLEVYRAAIAGPFKAIWISELSDRSIKIEDRLLLFYEDYFKTIFNGRWLRLFMHSSLANGQMAPDYISDVVVRVLDLIAIEVAAEQHVALPNDKAIVREICWGLHGGLSHFALRKHLYRFPQAVAEQNVIAAQIALFLGGFKTAIETLAPREMDLIQK